MFVVGHAELEHARAGAYQSWCMPELEHARAGACQNWSMPELEHARAEACPNWSIWILLGLYFQALKLISTNMTLFFEIFHQT